MFKGQPKALYALALANTGERFGYYTMLAVFFAEVLETSDKKLISELKQELMELPNKIEETLKLEDTVKNMAKQIYLADDMFFLGRGIDYPVAMEGSLKLKEISYIHSEAYPGGELKHGPISLIDNGFPVIGIITDEELASKTISNIQEACPTVAASYL